MPGRRRDDLDEVVADSIQQGHFAHPEMLPSVPVVRPGLPNKVSPGLAIDYEEAYHFGERVSLRREDS